MKNICLVQARLCSSRFPQKILQKINNQLTVLDLLFYRLSRSEYIDEILFCIPDSDSDNKLAGFLNKKKYKFKRGHPYDLVKRYLKCLEKHSNCNIIRVTSDCPLVDPIWIDKGIKTFNERNLMYLSNYTPAKLSKFCNGSDIEIFTKETLIKLEENFKDEKDREHVTFPLWDGRLDIESLNMSCFIKENISDIRITLDYPEDLVVLKSLARNLCLKKASLYEIANEYRKQGLAKVNGMHTYYEGWK